MRLECWWSVEITLVMLVCDYFLGSLFYGCLQAVKKNTRNYVPLSLDFLGRTSQKMKLLNLHFDCFLSICYDFQAQQVLTTYRNPLII